jgi:two-component sensor histidine kinase
LAYGVVLAIIAVAIRVALPIEPDVLPFFTVLIAICIATVVGGLGGGAAAMVTGGVLAWYFLLTPYSFHLDDDDHYAVLGFVLVAVVILWTAELYRRSEARRQAAALELMRKEADQQRTFAAEMSHRLKNALTIVQAIAGQTFSASTPAMASFEGRLKALADAHKLLINDVAQPTAPVRALVQQALSGFDGGGRVRTAGEDEEVPAQEAITLALALHELATNAVKYGALSNEAGFVSVEWRVDGRTLWLEWEEHDGPEITKPAKKGFGSKLLARTGPQTEMTFDAKGLRCRIALHL